MSQTKNVRPDANLAVVGWSSLPSGATPQWQAISEAETFPAPVGSAYSYIKTAAGVAAADSRFSTATYVLASDERCRRIRVRAIGHVTHSSTVGKAEGRVGATVISGPTWQAATDVRQLVTGLWHVAGDAGPEGLWDWTQAEIDSIELRGRVQSLIDPSGRVGVDELWMELDVVKRAVVTPAAPASAERDPSTVVPWTYVGDGDAQKAYQLRVFTKAATLVGGFDPAVTAPTYDSGEIVSSATSQLVPEGVLAYGTEYVAFVRAAKDVNGATWWGTYMAGGWAFTTAAVPVVAVDVPPDDTNRPLVDWSVTQLESTSQAEYRVKVFKQPAGGWAGFNPDTNEVDLVEDSGQVGLPFGTATQYQVAGSLLNATTYRAYVKAWKSSPEIGRPTIPSAWAFTTWTTDFDAPPTPSIVTAVAANGVDIDVTVTPGVGGAGIPDEDHYIVERRIDGGAWATFNLGGGDDSSLIVPAAEPFTITDHEAPLQRLVEYRATAVTTALGSPVASLASNVDGETLSAQTVWLKDTYTPASNQELAVEHVTLERTVTRARTIHRPLNRTKPLVVRGVADGSSFELRVLLNGRQAYDDIAPLLDSDHTLFVQAPIGSWYVELSGDLVYSEQLWELDELRSLVFPVVEVAG